MYFRLQKCNLEGLPDFVLFYRHFQPFYMNYREDRVVLPVFLIADVALCVFWQHCHHRVHIFVAHHSEYDTESFAFLLL